MIDGLTKQQLNERLAAHKAEKDAIVHFLRGVGPFSHGECWLWQRAKNPNGYGVASGKERLAHRRSYVLFRGPIPSGMFVCHTCDTPACVNPDHLFVGTIVDNNLDKTLKGRASQKLTPEIVREIRASKGVCKETGRQFGVSPATICTIRNRKTWGHLS